MLKISHSFGMVEWAAGTSLSVLLCWQTLSRLMGITSHSVLLVGLALHLAHSRCKECSNISVESRSCCSLKRRLHIVSGALQPKVKSAFVWSHFPGKRIALKLISRKGTSNQSSLQMKDTLLDWFIFVTLMRFSITMETHLWMCPCEVSRWANWLERPTLNMCDHVPQTDGEGWRSSRWGSRLVENSVPRAAVIWGSRLLEKGSIPWSGVLDWGRREIFHGLGF